MSRHPRAVIPAVVQGYLVDAGGKRRQRDIITVPRSLPDSLHGEWILTDFDAQLI